METQPVSTPKNGAPPATSTALAVQPPASTATVEVNRSGDIVRVGFDTAAGFEALQRISRAFAASTLVPDAFKGNIANCLIAVEMAGRMGVSPLMAMQNLYLVHGRPSWSSQFLIATFNHCGRFSAIKYRWSGKQGTPTWGCVAWAKEKETGEIVESPEVTMAMAKAEGWIDKKGSKWLTIPQLMLTYRAATFLVRTTAPELTMGLRSAEEQEDAIDIEPRTETTVPGRGVAGLKALSAPPVVEEYPIQPQVAEPAHDPETGEAKEQTKAEDPATQTREQPAPDIHAAEIAALAARQGIEQPPPVPPFQRLKEAFAGAASLDALHAAEAAATAALKAKEINQNEMGALAVLYGARKKELTPKSA